MSTKQKWLVGISIFLSICAAILSVIAICRTSERTLGLDYIGVIVGVLGVTITVLIGWQIFALVDARSIKSDLEQIQTDLKNEIYRNCADIYGDIAFVHGKMDDIFNDTIHTINKISLLSKAGDFDKCDKEIEKCILLGLFEKKIGEYQHILLYKRLNEIPNTDKISKFGDFVSFINDHFPLDEEDVKKNQKFRQRMKEWKQQKTK